MKKINLIEWLSRNSHEKQSPQRFGWYAVMLIMLLTLGVGQMWANTYWYAGSSNSWGADAMTVSSGGKYEYIQIAKQSGTLSAKIRASSSNWNTTWGRQYTASGYVGTDVTNMNSSSSSWGENSGDENADNICIYYTTKVFYIIVFYPNTNVNTTNNPIVCASTTLPDDASYKVYFCNYSSWPGTMYSYAWFTGNNPVSKAWPGNTMTSTGKTNNGKTIYYVDYNIKYPNIKFDNNSSETSNLTLGSTNAGKMYNNGWGALAYDVTLDQQSGSGGTSSITATCGSAMPGSKTAPTRAGYTFGGYYTGTNGSGTKYYDADMTSAATWPADGSGPNTLYAKWLPQSLTITAHPDYLTTTDKLNLSISYENIPSGYCYRVKELRTGGYYNSEAHGTYDPISGTGSITYTSSASLPLGADRIVLELWNGTPGAQQTVVSNEVAVTVEQGWEVGVQAKTDDVISTAGGTVSPASVSPTAHIGRTITAEAKVGYDFTGWTANTVNITFDDASELSTTVKATAGGTVYANFAKQSGSYSTTFYAGDHGSIVVDETDIAKNGNETITIGENVSLEATPESNYLFDHWGTTGSVSVADTYGASTTVTATDAGGTVTAYYRHVPELGAVTATPSGQQNYAGSPIDFALSVTSTYMAHPVVVFLVNDGTTTFEVVGAPYGADGNSAAGTIGSDAANTTVHKATFTASAAHNYTVSAKLYEGLLLANFNGKDFTGGGGWNNNGGGHESVSNPAKQAVNGSNTVHKITRGGGNWYDTPLYWLVATDAHNTGSTSYRYIHTRQYREAASVTKWKANNAKGDLEALGGISFLTNTWQKVAYDNAGTYLDFMFPLIVEGGASILYIDDIILSNEASMTEKASQAATASFSINWNYTVTLNNNGATSAGTTSVNVTYGSSVSNIEVPTKTGYTFGGYYTEDAGAGTLQINASGVWQNAGYLSGGNWNSGSNQTLYAKWGKDPSLTGLVLSTSLVTTGNTFTATPTIDAGDGRTTIVCWEVQTAAGVKLDPQPSISPEEGNAVTITAPATPGNYKVVATLKEGTGCEGTVLNSLQQSFTVQGNYTVSITNGTGSSSVGEETTATVTADAATAGMKFDHWNVTGTISYTSGDANSRTITFNASSDISLTAVYVARTTKKVYFAKPSSWENVYAYAWQDGNATNKNGDWTATAITSNTETIKGTTYHYYQYYIDDNGETGGNKTAQAAWDRIIFHQGTSPGTAQSTKTEDLTLVDGHFYHIADGNGENGRDVATLSGSASAEDWYVCGYWNQSTDDWGFAHPVDLNGTTSGSVVVTVTASRTQEFKIYRASTDQWFKWTGGPSADYYDNYAALIGDPMTLRIYDLNRNTFTSYATEYLFTLDITSTSNPVLTVVPNENTPYSATLSKNGHGSLSVGTGAITLKQYIPTTITATPEPGYRFTGWTTTGSVAYAGGTSSSDATASFTATASDGTITANFSNSEVIYFDAGNIENEWGDDVYVTFLKYNFHWNEGDGKDGALIVENWVDNALHSVRMTRIPNTRIFYLDYSNLSGHDQVTQYVLFTSKSIPSGIYRLYDMAAVTRGDYNKASGNNMCVAENFREKDKNKTGYYCGYWMNYNDTKAGIKLKVYSGGGAAIDVDDDFTLASGSRTFTAKVTLSASTTYSLSLQGDNGTWYNNDNSGTMTSLSCTAWPFVDRQSTPGHITTTAGGEYTFTLNCADKLYLTADFPLAVNDYKLVFSGKVAVGGIDETYSSSVIRHIGDEGTKKDTLGFFVVKGDSWTLQLKRCTSIDPITWVNVGEAKTAAKFGSPATGIYNFIVQQDSTTGIPVTPAYATMTPEAYTGNYYIRTDGADGGWEAYKRALDNRMIFSNYAKSQSNFDYYHCRFANNGTNVKFCIANDYSARLSDTLYTDSYVTTGEGVLPADASVRFMWNSETNVLSRAYLNGSHTTDFLLLEAKSDSLMNIDGSAIAEAGTIGSIKFRDMGNWIYQKEIQALPGTRVRLTSNYRFNSADHIQYFKGESGDWSETGANTEQIIGGTTTGWEKLRLVYDFKTNHLTSAWLPPTDPIDEAKSINADMLLIRRGQNAAQQLTFGGSGKIANVKTIVGAMEFVKDSIVGRVSHFNGDVIGVSGNRANRELMHYISFPFDVAVNDIYGFGQLNKEWYLQYYDGAERASKGFFRGDGTTTFWKYMTLADTLRANVGYSLLLDNDYFNTTGEGTVWHNTISDSIYLYFPSAKELSADSVIKTGTKTIRVPEHKHTSGRTFEVDSRTLCHDFTDSDWNMMGVPLFQNQTGLEAHFGYVADPTDWPGDGKGYFYEWDSIRNNFEIHTAVGYTFKSMHGYMVQYSGEVSFTGASIQPASSVVARRAQKSRENYTMELQLLKENKRTSRTYIELREEACDTFALDEDVYMVYTSHPADLYTYAGNYDVSANVLSMDNHSIPVGIEVHQAGEYTFTMPSSFNGAATLIDTQTGARTNLALGDYTVSLPKGVCDGRFFIELDLNKMPTAIDGVTDGSGSLRDGNAHKFIENGIMYILRDGILYDARGNKVK